MTAKRVAIGVLVLAGLFALLGGEYSTWDYYPPPRERRGAGADRHAEREVDSLEKVAKAAETDPMVQERMAREEYGMIRTGERVYSILRDSAGPPR